ncbi:hypothetical protein QQS21_004488 [Conoideocrella luteorostrata]|uniref:RING-type E3 ubiquitin transferase n=1 Tax=Conoideocrella luteorostrata TaxID=1105319 RepID=A0AAJ0CRA7_9HYPO|nr:hypothetical protein QQS21_004488 [Conoideocrella luteorostrata]
MNESPVTTWPRDFLPSRFDNDGPGVVPQPSDHAPAICRICRGEGTSAEPLFYPCKCSGSIKYVHQDCLMEWLSHSQKKYCELCKTSFRFTKLYAPDMPQSLPAHIFLEHMTKYLVRNLLIWLRAVVTISVWVCWLPYFMRIVWAFMFWVSDEGLGAGGFMSRQSSKATGLGPDASDPNGTCLVRTVFDDNPGDKITFLNTTATSLSPSLLSNVGFLKNFTRSSTINRTIITVIEGQIITVLVIVCFILVILVRDYVVQQQPEINMRAAFADQENNPPAPAQPVQPAEEAVEDDDGHESDELRSDDDTLDASAQVNVPLEHDVDPLTDADTSGPSTEEGAGQQLTSIQVHHESQESNAENDVDLPVLDSATNVMDYLQIYNLADGNPERMLQIMKEQDSEENLRPRVNVARRSIRERENTALQASGPSDVQHTTLSNIPIPPTADLDEFGIQGSTAPQQEVREPTQEQSKGKEVDWQPLSPELSPNPFGAISDLSPGPSRPRAHSDGPEVHGTPNYLAYNNWSFVNLPTTGGTVDAGPGQTSNPAVGSPEMAPAPGENTGQRGAPHTPDSPHQSNHGNEDMTLDHNIDAIQAIVDEPIVAVEPEQRGLVGRVANFMWGDLDQHREADGEHQQQEEPLAGGDIGADAGGDVAAEDPWVDDPVAEVADVNGDANAGVIEAAAAAGMDAEAMEDLEDFEGVMELLGMRGPIAGLFQNAIFCSVLVSVTVFACIFIPYNIGRVSLWIVANPIHLVRMFMGLSKVIQDAAMMIFGFGSWCALNIVDMFTGVVGGVMGAKIVSARKASWGVWTGAGSRVVDYALMEFPMTASEVQNFSAISHEALNSVKGNIGWAINQIDIGLAAALTGPDVSALLDGRFFAAASAVAQSVVATMGKILAVLSEPNSWVIDLGDIETRSSVDLGLAYWSSTDRFWAILTGYLTVFAVGALYLKRGSPFSRGGIMQAWEAGVIDTLHQASGIMKVILIISIEMLAFPLYCGLLLDGALLPLFENTTFKSRILFTCNYPLTSIFVHWFVGTGYMFHFALFVSMCRKIMRPGVLYFIRDPDDPEFHPVRDVLERNLTTQLRKILFSAFVYGALVVVCLGGVVWGLYYAMPGVLPVHYSSNEPVLEFPVDLLFYNFLMPLAVKFFKPSDGLHAMYTWWFRKCARGLRLTYFLFGERRIDEEGILKLGPGSQHEVPPHKAFFLELDENNNVIPKTWRDTFEGGDAKPNPAMSKTEMREWRHKKAHLVKEGQLEKSGRFVRAPASDRVKIPKGQKVFLTVSERGRRKDDNEDTDLYASDQYQLVYVPPNFRARVFLFILFIWLFAAVTGVGFTIAPLVLGRAMFKILIPAHIRTNDIYAFSIGIYILGSLAYAILRIRHVTAKFRDWASKVHSEISGGNGGNRVIGGIVHGAKLLYTYFFLLIVFPLVVSTLMELYVSIPLHTYMNPPKPQAIGISAPSRGGDAGSHTIRVIQSWTLGLLYLNLATRMITSLFPDARVAVAVRSVMRRGYLKPDVEVLTRAFIVPGITLSVVAIFGPPLIARLLIKFGTFGPTMIGTGSLSEMDTVKLSLIYRHSYPAAAVAAHVIKYAIGLTRVFSRWASGVRDDAYLIGERLHNFGAATAGARKARRAWGAAGGGRL